jgi:hypothetical protein
MAADRASYILTKAVVHKRCLRKNITTATGTLQSTQYAQDVNCTWVSMRAMATTLPVGVWRVYTLDHIRIPVVSRSMPPLKEENRDLDMRRVWRGSVPYTLDHIRKPVVSRSMPPLKEEKQGFRHETGLESVHLGPHQDTCSLALYAAPEVGKTGI